MANSDKNIIITPFVSGLTQPQIKFVGQGNDPIYLKVLDGITGTGATAGGALSVEGSAGQLFSIVNRLGTGSIFSVNDISGLPIIDVNANGTLSLAPSFGNVGVGLTGPTTKFQVNGDIFASGLISSSDGVSIGVTSQMIRNGVNSVRILDYQTTTTSATTANQNIASWLAISDTIVIPPSVDIRSMEITVQAENSTTLEYERIKFLVIHDNTNTYLTEISDIRTGRSLATYSTTLTTSGDTKILYLRATPANASSTIFKVTTSQISTGI